MREGSGGAGGTWTHYIVLLTITDSDSIASGHVITRAQAERLDLVTDFLAGHNSYPKMQIRECTFMSYKVIMTETYAGSPIHTQQ
jgi:hypothetical protein